MTPAPLTSADDGVSLIETIVALVVFAIIAVGVAAMTVTGLRAGGTSRMYQQATGVGEQAIETARSLGYTNLVMTTSDLSGSGDTHLLTSCTGLTGSWFFTPDGLSHCEAIPTVTSGTALALHPTSPISAITVSEWVTWVDTTTQGGTGQNAKRVTVHVTWNDHGVAKSYVTMTVLSPFALAASATRSFTVSTTSASAFASGGYPAVWAATVTNTGTAPDSANVTAKLPTGVSWPVTMYADSSSDGALNAYNDAHDAQLVDTNGDGVVDTGRIAANGTSKLLLAVTPPAGTTAGTYAVTLTMTSTTTSTATVSASLTLTVASAASASNLYLHNSATQPLPNTATTAQLNMPMDNTTPTANFTNNMPDIANDVKSGVHGRYMNASGSGSSTTVSTAMADWVYGTLAGDVEFAGSIPVTVYAQGCGTTSVPAGANLVAYLGIAVGGVDSTGTTWLTSNASTPAAVPTSTTCTGTGLTAISFSLPAPSSPVILSSTSVLELKIVSTSGSVFLGYDASALGSKVSLPVVAT